MRLFLVPLVGACLGLAGCNSGEPTQPAGGTVSVDGTPVDQGKIIFHPVGGGRQAAGRIGKDGSYLLSYRTPGDGLPVGEYKVTIVVDKFDQASVSQKNQDLEDLEIVAFSGKLTHIVPVEYNTRERTPLTVTVTDASEPQRFDFDIASK